MKPQDLQPVIDTIWEEQQNGIHCPADLRGQLDVESGYRVQLALLDRAVKAHQAQAGWKVGLTAEAIQKQVGHFERVFGYLLEANRLASGASLVVEELIRPTIEPELCLILGQPLKGPGVTVEQARAAIVAAAPAVEVVERRGDFVADIPLSLADNTQQRYFVAGPPMQPLPAALPLGEVTLQVLVNGEVVDQAKGTAVLDTPAGSVAWLANRLADFGRRLEPGMQIMSGSFTKQIAITKGDVLEARFDPVGSVTVEFT